MEELLQAAQTTATRLRRQLEPAPPGFPPGEPHRLCRHTAAASEPAPQAGPPQLASNLHRPRLHRPFPAPAGPSGEAAVQLLQQPLGFLEQLRRQYGTVVGLLLGGERVVLVAGAASEAAAAA